MYLPKAGDIFCFPITASEMLSGRVLLDVNAQCIAPQRIKADSRLGFFRDALLVEVHGVPVTEPRLANERILVPSLFVGAELFSTGAWRVIGESRIDPTEVSFPAALIAKGVQPHVSWGEVLVPIRMEFPEFLSLDILHTTHNPADLAPMCLVALGREAEVDRAQYPNLGVLRFESHDFRLSPLGPDLFTRAGLPAQPRYFDEALARGFDTRRFYAPDPRAPFLVCPFCWSVRTPEAICWACGEDTSRDAAIETTQDELATIARKACPTCGTMIPELALRCPKCRAVQPD